MASSAPAAHVCGGAAALKCGLTHPAWELQQNLLSVRDSEVGTWPPQYLVCLGGLWYAPTLPL